MSNNDEIVKDQIINDYLNNHKEDIIKSVYKNCISLLYDLTDKNALIEEKNNATHKLFYLFGIFISNRYNDKYYLDIVDELNKWLLANGICACCDNSRIITAFDNDGNDYDCPNCMNQQNDGAQIVRIFKTLFDNLLLGI